MELKYNVLGINYFTKKFKDNKKYYDIHFNKNVIFKNCIFKKGLIFENCNFEGKLEIINCDGKIEIKHPKGLKNIKIYNDGENIDKKLEIKINNIKFDKEGDYFFSGSSLKKITFKSCVNLSDYFKMTHLNDIELNFIDVNLGKTTFNGVKIKKLYLKNATLNDCIFNGVEFPKNYELKKGKLSNKVLKDNYRQLKHVMDSNGNITEANSFFEKEMEYYLKSLDIKKMGFFGTFKELFDSNFLGNNTKKIGEKIVLLFGWNVNEFGNNWIKPLEGIIILALIATLSDISSSFFGIKYGNYLGDLFFVIFVVISFIILVYTKVGKIVDSKLSKVNNLKSIVFLFVIILLGFLIPNYDPIKVFANFLNPLFLKENGVVYDGIEIFGLVLYKTIYGILLWHLIIALKRTTKR